MSHVLVPVKLFRDATWTLATLERDARSWGAVNREDRAKLLESLEFARSSVGPIGQLQIQDVTLEVEALKRMRRLFVTLSLGVHSARRVQVSDRRKALGLIKRVTTNFDRYIQLDLFAGQA